MSDLISREALKKKLQARHDNGEEDFDKGYNIGIETAIDLIDNAPSVELQMGRMTNGVIIPIERPQGKWIKVNNPDTNIWTGGLKCSECGRGCVQESMNFCSNCGADMRGAE